jgi:deoxyadenosine/deoxycytidine kinase
MGLMNTRDFETYKSLFDLMESFITPPDLLIYLKASVPTLIKQIERRGREYESSIRLDYITSLNNRYNSWIEQYSNRKLIINMDDLNITDNPKDLGFVVDSINAEINGLF